MTPEARQKEATPMSRRKPSGCTRSIYSSTSCTPGKRNQAFYEIHVKRPDIPVPQNAKNSGPSRALRCCKRLQEMAFVKGKENEEIML
jgi:hypothetical protein